MAQGPLSRYLNRRDLNETANMQGVGLLQKMQAEAQARAMNEQFRRDQLAATIANQQESIKSREGIAAQSDARARELAGQQALDRQALERQRALDREAQLRLAAQLRPAPQEPQPIVQTDEEGNTKLFDRTGKLIKDLGKTGKVAPGVLKEREAKAKMQRDLADIVPTLEEISKEGGLLDQATGSGFGTGVDIAAGFFGIGTPGAIAIGKLKPATDAVLKLVPRFEGPQSDKDTKMYQDAAGNLANPSTPNSVKKEAAKTILKLYKQRQGQFVTRDFETATSGSASPEGGWKDL